MKAAIYSRVSTEDQDFSKQTNELKDYAKKENIYLNSKDKKPARIN